MTADGEETEYPLGLDSQRYVQGLARGLQVMKAFDSRHPRMRVAEVAKRCNVARAVARRSLLTLVSLGYVRVEDDLYELTPRVLEFGWAYLSSDSLAGLGQPFLEELTQRTGESSSLAVLDDEDILYVGRVHAKSLVRIDITVGARFPALATAMGRVLLAAQPDEVRERIVRSTPLAARTPRTTIDPDALREELGRVARQGWAFVDQEFDLGLRSLAVPVVTGDGRTVAAMNVAFPVVADEPVSEGRMDELLRELRRGADGLAVAYGGTEAAPAPSWGPGSR